MDEILKNINSLKQVKEIEHYIDDYSPIFLSGLADGFKPHLALTLFKRFNETCVLIAEDEKKAYEYINDINGICDDTAVYYPNLDINFYNIKAVDNEKLSQRLNILTKLSKKENYIIVTTLDAITNKLTTLDEFNNGFVKIKDEDVIDVDCFIKKLVSLNYSPTNLVESKGDFAKRGSIIDFWPAHYDNPIRLELFDDEIDSIRFFDKDNQRTLEIISEVEVGPASELLYGNKEYDKVIDNINKDISSKSKIGDSFQQKFINKYKQIISYIEDNMYVANQDLINAYRYSNYQSFLDYLPNKSLIFFDDVTRIIDNHEKTNDNFLEDLTLQMENGEVSRSFENVRIPIEDIYSRLEEFRLLNLTSILKKSKKFNPKRIIEIKSIESENFNRKVDDFINRTIELANKGSKILVLSSNEKMLDQLYDAYLSKDFFKVSKVDDETEFPTNPIGISEKSSSNGYYIPNLNFYVFTHKEIYGNTRKSNQRKSKKKTSSRDIINYSDLEIGDYVVHENNGIGLYKGLEKIEVNNTEKDFVVIEYRGTDKLFVPVDQMNLISKYIGSRGESPKLSSLGTPTWQKAKARAKKAVDEIADDLVKLYAERSKIKGHAFSKDSAWQNDFENSFPFEETYSQIRSINEIKSDMESDKPMDRLLCGDVGYGKTEVAIRAAFKAIMDGYQVAFLVPTTILANQHYETIKKRFAKFPANVQMLSRFNSKNKNDLIIKDLKAGKVDLVIGTHRLLSKDVSYNKLGLLIIDEEQRFGVKHKEQLKELKSSLDVLTLSATPIPRTLQMSLSGIRDLSTLDEPPEERMPVNTYVIEYDNSIIKQAIEREISRGGQVYFVYNRVNDIEKLYNHIIDLVPDASVSIIHGKLSPKQIEKTMLQFIDGEIDVLLSTTIIETGMDISNVNTMIIYDADMMGLSQLYQLKGRIGRGNRSSHAYFTYRTGKVLTDISEKRLKSIRDFSDFGSGYKIAMKDLELRGAGNLLGESQSGHVEAIGYDLYVKFLQEAVEKASGKEVTIKDKEDIYIDIKVDGYIPSFYIEDQSQKIEIYKRIALIQDDDDYNELVGDLIDVYGDLPVMVDNLMYISMIKALADELKFSEIREKKGNVNIYFKDKDKFSFEELAEINETFEGDMSLDLSNKPAFMIPVSKTKLMDTYELLKIIKKVRSKQ